MTCQIEVEYIEQADKRIELIDRQNIVDFNGGDLQACFDADKLRFPLVLRVWRSGDRFLPFGMGGASKKVSDLLSDMKVSRFDKEQIRVLVSGDDIVWVVGLRTDNRYRVVDSTQKVAKITL